MDFAAGRFFEAHEEWERLWLGAAGQERLFLQGLIQLAAACVHFEKGRPAPAARLLVLARTKLSSVVERRSEFDLSGLLAVLTAFEHEPGESLVQELRGFFDRAAVGGFAPEKRPAGQSSAAANPTEASTSESG